MKWWPFRKREPYDVLAEAEAVAAQAESRPDVIIDGIPFYFDVTGTTYSSELRVDFFVFPPAHEETT